MIYNLNKKIKIFGLLICFVVLAPNLPQFDLVKEFIGQAQVGAREASKLGMPTINVPIPAGSFNKQTHGTYVAYVWCADVNIPGLAFVHANRAAALGSMDYSNDGTRQQLLEVHILEELLHKLGYEGNFAGLLARLDAEKFKVNLVDKISDVIPFTTQDAMKEKIANDRAKATAWWNERLT